MASTFDFSKSHYSQLEWELKYALDNTSKEEFKEWAKCTALVFPKVTVRRAKNLGEFAGSLAKELSVKLNNSLMPVWSGDYFLIQNREPQI